MKIAIVIAGTNYGGLHRLVMKGPDNSTSTSIQSFMRRIKAKDIEVVVSDPSLKETEILHSRVVNDLVQFKQQADDIVANRIADEIRDVADKAYSRDLFGKD